MSSCATTPAVACNEPFRLSPSRLLGGAHTTPAHLVRAARHRVMIFTGMYGESDVRLVHLETGEVEARTRLPGHHFGEGLAKLGDRLYQLTWERPDGFIYSTQDVQKVCGGMRQV